MRNVSFALGLLMACMTHWVCAAEPVDYDKQVAPMLRKYCGGCHNAIDPAGKLAVDSFDLLMKGGENGATVSPGNAEASRMVRLLTGKAEPKMPPADEAQPAADDVALLKLWIEQGAKGPAGKMVDLADLPVPKVKVISPRPAAVNQMALSPDGKTVALARYAEVELRSWPDGKEIRRLTGIRGTVNGLDFSPSGDQIVAAAGEPGITGQAVIWNASTGEVVKTLRGHRDAMLGARFSYNAKFLATCSYDQTIALWDLATGEIVRSLDGHNGAVYEVAFRPDDKVLASASGDRTVKLWNIATGERLDTLIQSTKELYCLAFDPSGNKLIAGGVDNRIRQWQITGDAAEGTNPILVSQFAHEMPLLRLVYSRDGRTIVSTGEDARVKLWNGSDLAPRATLETQPDWVTGASFSPDGKSVVLARRDGTSVAYPVPQDDGANQAVAQTLADVPPPVDYGPQPRYETLTRVVETEPNHDPASATTLAVPAIGTGAIDRGNESADVDLFRFAAKTGEQWIVETRSDPKTSMVDTKIEILDAAGKAVPRLLLRAIRDTEVEFRSMSSDQRGVRLKNWEEMLLNEFIYLNGDVMKHFRQRRGPDGDADFYPENGLRHAYFDTTARAHALGEPGYVVVPYPLGTTFADNGLPVFTLNYENDDDGSRKLGRNSKLTFVAPADGEYLVRVSDVRGSSSPRHTYELIVRRPQPDFTASVSGATNVTLGGGRTLTFKVDRIDNFMGPVRFEVERLPPGITITQNVVVQEGLTEAMAVLHASPFAPAIEAGWDQVKITAVAQVAGKEVRHDVAGLGKITLAERAKVVPYMELIDQKPEEYAPVKPRAFTPVVVKSVASLGGATLKIGEDASVIATADNPDADSYIVVASPAGDTKSAPIKAIRLDVLADESLPGKAPGRAGTNGNLVLGEVRITAAPKGKPALATPVKVAIATADHSQDGYAARNLIDGKPETAWAIASNGPNNTFPVKRNLEGKLDHSVVFELAESLTLEPGGLLIVTLDQPGAPAGHNIGKFRVSTTSDPIVETPQPPRMQEIVIAPGGSITLKLRVDRHEFNDRIAFEVQNLPHGIIVDDIGLSGVLVRENELERTIFLRAEPWVGEQSRPFFAQANVEGNQCTRSMTLHVRRDRVATAETGK